MVMPLRMATEEPLPDLGALGFALRPLSLLDTPAIAECIRDDRFSFPLLTGRAGRARSVLGSLARACRYTIVCVAGNALGRFVFGERLHWIMAIATKEGSFAGVVMIAEVVRARAARRGPGARFLNHPERRLPLLQGDGELGFFLHPRYWGKGIASAASVELIRRLGGRNGEDAPPVLKRVWAETGRHNVAARRLLERLGLPPAPELPVSGIERYERDGRRIDLVHYGRPATSVETILRIAQVDVRAPVRGCRA